MEKVGLHEQNKIIGYYHDSVVWSATSRVSDLLWKVALLNISNCMYCSNARYYTISCEK
ncbi:hypothetical protein GCM10008018_56940 [Paenibacillus marchantiophytorum]|uniref:Uncharacterized protein n=1 Tax=Paenibacillus marchantiophytorum TaxID=1619310 RepID=A0ABQ1F933_9BACL|nr:hypothetical protein GCM10008018_56940 [Paenibacillus marchantiophytorum]